MIGEDDFWRNYFYRIEYLKKQLGLEPTRLGARIPDEQRQQALKQRMENDDEEYDAEIQAQARDREEEKTQQRHDEEDVQAKAPSIELRNYEGGIELQTLNKGA